MPSWRERQFTTPLRREQGRPEEADDEGADDVRVEEDRADDGVRLAPGPLISAARPRPTTLQRRVPTMARTAVKIAASGARGFLNEIEVVLEADEARG